MHRQSALGMRRWSRGLIAIAAFAVLSTPTFAEPQKPAPPADHMPRKLKDADVDALKEGMASIKVYGECNAIFTVSKEGKPKDIKPNCTPAEYDPYVVRAISATEWDPELFHGETFDTENMKMPFRLGNKDAAAGSATKAPTPTKPISKSDLQTAFNRVGKPGVCDIVLTVKANGEPADIVPNCNPNAYDAYVRMGVAQARFNPGEKDGKPVDTPNFHFPLNIGAAPTR